MSCPFVDLTYENEIDCYNNCPINNLCARDINVIEDIHKIIHDCLVEYDNIVKNKMEDER